MPRQSDVRYVGQRLSLRKPQLESLDLLDRVCDVLSLAKDADVAKELTAFKAEFPKFDDFERDFPSLCFALATGVGKTRLMGAFISYLYKARGIRHFFVLAPNLTIYNKLIADFTRGTPKYVFQGIDAFATVAPRLITGDNYEEVRLATPGADQPVLFDTGEAHINVFNISKINSEVRGGREPKFKRMREVLGGSYFEYLAGLPDLVLLMDESHRYRAEAGMKAINELKPILGLELTATPQTERSGPFKNVVYSYPLSEALKDGFVKEPAVATRENFRRESYDDAALERLKLEDGMKIHEVTKSRLEAYARNSGERLVRPFVLVVAHDTKHAEQIKVLLESPEFLEGNYRGKTMTVHSNQRGTESDEAVQQLLALESPDNPIEVVIHVNKLGEGWDVTNLYTLIPLRAANARNLVEQSIGRGLRLPYGKRTGVKDVDRLTVVAHDRFQEILDEANRPDSLIRSGVVIGRDIPEKAEVVVQSKSILQLLAVADATPDPYSQQAFDALFTAPAELKAAESTLVMLEEYRRIPVQQLQQPGLLAEITKRVEAAALPAQAELQGIGPSVDVAAVVAKTIQAYVEHQIAIPKVMVFPKEQAGSLFAPFTLDVSVFDRETFSPVPHDILIQHLSTNEQEMLDAAGLFHAEPRFENYVVRALWNKDDVNRSDAKELEFLYALASQAVDAFKKKGLAGGELDNVLAYYGRRIGELVYAQMLDHPAPSLAEFEYRVTQGHTMLKPSYFNMAFGERPFPFRQPVESKKDIRGMVFSGFKKCLREREQFQSDPERRFAIILEDDTEVLRWAKLAKDQVYLRLPDNSAYLPDFVVETATGKWLVEVKAANEINDADVQLKAKVAVIWCQHASEYEKANAGKPWGYSLVPDDAISAQARFGALARTNLVS